MLYSRRRRLERLFPSVGGGGATPLTVDSQIPYDDTRQHPAAIVAGVFDQGNTAAWKAWLLAHPMYDAAYSSNLDNIILDTGHLYAGRPTLRFDHTTQNGQSAIAFLLPTAANKIIANVVFETDPGTVECGGVYLHDSEAYNAAAALDFFRNGMKWIDGESGVDLLATARSVGGRKVYLHFTAERIDDTQFKIRGYVNGEDTGEVTVSAYAPYPGFALVKVYYATGIFGAHVNPGGVIRLLDYQFVDAADNATPWIELDQPQVTITPSECLVNPGDTIQFSSNVADSWTCTGGTIDGTGLFTAGMTEAEFSVTAHKGDRSASAVVEIATYDPLTDVPSLVRYHDVHAMGFANNAVVSAITDQMGNADLQQPVPGVQPLAKTNVLGGKTVIETDGVDDNIWEPAAGSDPYGARTYIAVARMLPGQGAGSRNALVIVGGFGRLSNSGSVVHWSWVENTGAVNFIIGALNTEWAILQYRINSAASADVRLNNGNWINFNPTDEIWDQPGVNGVTQIGGHTAGAGGDWAKAQFALDVLATGAQTDADIRKFRRFLNGHFGGIY